MVFGGSRTITTFLLTITVLVSLPYEANANTQEPIAVSCAQHIQTLSSELAAFYFSKWDPRYYKLRHEIRTELNARFPNLDSLEHEEITRHAYRVLRVYETHRDRAPPIKSYLAWGLSISAPIISTGVSWVFIPMEYVPAVSFLSGWLSAKFFDPMGAAVQEKWNGRLRNASNSRKSLFKNSRSEYNQYLAGLNDRAQGAQSVWEDAGDGKLRAIESAIRIALSDAYRAHLSGDTELSVKFAADVAVDYLVRWTYLQTNEKSLYCKVQNYLLRMESDYRARLRAEILSRRDIKESPAVREYDVDHLLDVWMPHTT